MSDDCTCEDSHGEFHSCPYAEDVGGDSSDDYCDCCASCTIECGQSI